MPMMARMRSLAPWFMFLVGGIFVLFMVLSDSKLTDFFNQQKQIVGSIDGEDVTYQEYSNLVDRARRNQEQQSRQSLDESQMDFFRDQVWDALVTQKLIEKKVKEFGIIVTDDEIRNSLLGSNPPEQLKKQFTDSTGNFNRKLYEQTMRDPRNREIVIQVEEQIRQQLIQQKLQDYLTASITVSEEEAKDNFFKQNVKMKANYVMIDVNSISDNEIKVSDDELKKYYNEHRGDYKIEAQRKLKYVLFHRQASQSDSSVVKKNLEELVKKLKGDTTSFKKYVEIYSERPYSKDTVSLSSLPVQARDLLVKANADDIIGPLATFEGYVVYKLVNKVKAKKDEVRASHILVRSTGSDKADLEKATGIYNELMKGANFATVAKEKSDDGSKLQGGDLGWFGKGQMVKPFEDASFNGKIGVIQKPVKTQFGYHIIKVTDKSSSDFVVEKIVNKIQISATTTDRLYQDATDFSYIAKENGLESEAKLMKYAAIETPPFTKDALAIAGLGMNAALVKWAFDNSHGKVSEVYKISAGYVVAMVSDVIKPGEKKIDDVKAAIKSTVLRLKKLDKAMSLAAEIKSKIGNNGDASVAKTVWQSAKVDSTATEFTTTGNIPNIGRDFAFSDYSFKGEINKWSQPVKGSLGAYLIKVKYRTKYDLALFNYQKADIKKELLKNKKNRFFSLWLQNLKKETNIVDNRYLFYRY